MPKLRWEEDHKDCWYAYSGKLTIGMVIVTMHDTITWKIDAVSTRWITKGYDYEASSIKNAKRALQRSWFKWCEYAGFE